MPQSPKIDGKQLRIVGSGICLPNDPVSSLEIDRRLSLADQTTESTLGIRYRHFANDITSTEMAQQASIEAIETAGWELKDIDLVLSACAVMEQPIPPQSVLIHESLGLRATQAFDINSTCLSFLTALDVAWNMMKGGSHRRVLIVSSEIASRGLDWSRLEICGNFGDGAAAIALEAGNGAENGVLASHFETWSEGARACQFRAGGTLIDPTREPERVIEEAIFKMDGRTAYKMTAKLFPAFLDKLLAKAGLEITNIDLVIPHQASAHALEHLRKISRVPRERLMDIFATHGNQIAASIPTALHHALVQKRAKPGMKILLTGTAAGIGLGGMVLQL